MDLIPLPVIILTIENCFSKHSLIVLSTNLFAWSIDQANKFVERTINECFEKQFSIVNIITGKGMRSKSAEDPYKSSELSILKHSIPEFINSNVKLMKKIKNIDNTDEKNLGSFNVYLKLKNKFR